MVALAAIVLAVAIAGAGSTGTARTAMDAMSIAVAGLSSTACFLRARRSEAPTAWRALGACAGAWALEDAVRTWFRSSAAGAQPIPAIADGFFAAAAILGVFAMAAFSSRGGTLLRGLVDAAMCSGALAFIAWSTLQAHWTRLEFASAAQRVTVFAHPLIDATVVGTVVVLALSRRGLSSGVTLASLGLIVLASGDATSARIDPLARADLDAIRIAGYLLLLAAAHLASQPSDDAPLQRNASSRIVAAVPPAIVLAAAGLAAADQLGGKGLDAPRFWIVLGVLLTAVARAAVFARDSDALARSLETRIATRTAELHRALARADEARRTEDAFVSTISHELRTPLTTMLGATITMLRPEIDMSEDARVLAGIAHRGAERMSGLVEELLIASGIGGADRPAPGIPFDVGMRLHATLDAHVASALRVRASIPPGIQASGDPERFRIAVTQLLENAVKFAPDGPIDLSVAGDTDRVNVRVRDYGPGIPIHARERIFDRFYQVDASVTRARGGTGLGLFVARRLIEAMGGSLILEETGPGTSFCISLPAVGGRRLSLEFADLQETSGTR